MQVRGCTKCSSSDLTGGETVCQLLGEVFPFSPRKGFLIRAAAKEVFDELEASINEGADARKAFRKFRAELLRVYGFYRDLSVKAQSGNEKAMLDGLLADLEKGSRSAHEKYGYTYASLEELAEFQ